MEDAYLGTCLLEGALELEVATGVGGYDDVGIGLLDVLEFALLEATGHFWLGDVVDAGASAAEGGFWHFD